MDDNCIFCKIAKKEISVDTIYEDEGIFCFKDLNPQAPVHLLIIPKKHIDSVNCVSEEDSLVIGTIFRKAKDIAGDMGIRESGYRIIANCNEDGGQEVFHLHFHLLGGRALNWPPG